MHSSASCNIALAFPRDLASYQTIAEDSLSDRGGYNFVEKRTAMVSKFMESTRGFKHFDLSKFGDEDPGAAINFSEIAQRIVNWLAHDNFSPFLLSEPF